MVLTAAMSGANSGIYSSSRMLFKLSRDKETSGVFQKLSSHHVPYVSILAISGGILLGLILNTVLSLYKLESGISRINIKIKAGVETEIN